MRALGIVIIVLVVVVLAFAIFFAISATADRRRARRDREVQWAPYCHPAATRYEIGVERRTEDGRLLSKVEMHQVPLGDELERQVAENDAKLRAQTYNESKVGM